LARVVIPPKYGHAYNPARELNANNVMVAVRIGEIDSSEDGLISTNTSFRQVSLLRNPHKYGSTTVANNSTANGVISQTTNLDLIPGALFSLNEFVYQGSPTNPSAYGYVTDQTTTRVFVTRVKGSFTSGLLLVGSSTSIARTVIGVSVPEFQPYSGDILYATNESKVDRLDGQAENIKIVVSF